MTTKTKTSLSCIAWFLQAPDRVRPRDLRLGKATNYFALPYEVDRLTIDWLEARRVFVWHRLKKSPIPRKVSRFHYCPAHPKPLPNWVIISRMRRVSQSRQT